MKSKKKWIIAFFLIFTVFTTSVIAQINVVLYEEQLLAPFKAANDLDSSASLSHTQIFLSDLLKENSEYIGIISSTPYHSNYIKVCSGNVEDILEGGATLEDMQESIVSVNDFQGNAPFDSINGMPFLLNLNYNADSLLLLRMYILNPHSFCHILLIHKNIVWLINMKQNLDDIIIQFDDKMQEINSLIQYRKEILRSIIFLHELNFYRAQPYLRECYTPLYIKS